MQSRPILRYIHLGAAFMYLRGVQANTPIHGDGFIIANIGSVFEYLDEFNLPVTKRAANKLKKFGDKLAGTEEGEKLSTTDSQELSRLIEVIRETLWAESGGNIAFIATDKRIDVNKLLTNVRALLAPGIYDALPEIARYDFDEAGKCIAFERPTAAAFHLLRGTEEVLRQFYCAIVKQKRAELMWGPMVESLRKRRKSPPVALLDHLDHIRLNFRNPTQHPEKIYDIQEVQDLFSLCVDLVNRMVKPVKSRK